MTDEVRIANCELLAYLLEKNESFNDAWPELVRWLLADWRRLKDLDAEHADATDCLMQDAARWRWVEENCTHVVYQNYEDQSWTSLDEVDAAIAKDAAE